MTECQHLNTRCSNSRRVRGGRWRRQECKDCGAKFTTLEVIVGDKMPYGLIGEEALREKYGLTQAEKLQIKAVASIKDGFARLFAEDAR